MKDSYARLLKAARELKGARNEAAVAVLLDVSKQALHNWKSRGVPRKNLVEIEARIGAYPTWIATGEGRMSTGLQADQPGDPFIQEVVSAMRSMSSEDMRLMAELCRKISRKERHLAKTESMHVPRGLASHPTHHAAASPYWADRRVIERRQADNPNWQGVKDRRRYEGSLTHR
ncbi:helix-turn-helix domain-containing protein [Nitrosovibrio sp. Nv17]|jgi:hypothetical protein|uniref:helix-turn-helix domain-containing protein n=1 Tax=Nitrosovibrio sp. Nv17 TaxID=1855339 RepID=UPI000908EB4C|nr:helix-turn-helix domain-containing protein [Nitrosovibrio sp. Nv17]SFW15476.1 Bacteriophage CI repressor helix-turn-helix domain-containing protein [Nitrosovibrio sp. Nv17]